MSAAAELAGDGGHVGVVLGTEAAAHLSVLLPQHAGNAHAAQGAQKIDHGLGIGLHGTALGEIGEREPREHRLAVAGQAHMTHGAPLKLDGGETAVLVELPGDLPRPCTSGHHFARPLERGSVGVAVLEAAGVGHEAGVAAGGDDTLAVGAQKRRQLPDEQRRGGGVRIGVAEVAHGPGHRMMIHGDREGRRLVKARPIAEPLRRGHVHGDEALAGPFEARGGNEPVGPGQKHEIARRLLVAGKHARDLFAQLAQGPGEPQRRTKAVAVRAHMTSDDEVVALGERGGDLGKRRVGLGRHRHETSTPDPLRWFPPRCASPDARARNSAPGRWPRPDRRTCPRRSAAPAPRARRASSP